MNECNGGMHEDGEKRVTQNCDERAGDILETASDNSPSALTSVKQQRVSNQNHKRKNGGATMQTFIDNKRKQLKRIISPAQRDQMLLNLAKKELNIKEAMMASLGKGAIQTSKGMDKTAKSISSFGKMLDVM